MRRRPTTCRVTSLARVVTQHSPHERPDTDRLSSSKTADEYGIEIRQRSRNARMT
jgi:hypothetical protein